MDLDILVEVDIPVVALQAFCLVKQHAYGSALWTRVRVDVVLRVFVQEFVQFTSTGIVLENLNFELLDDF